MARCSSLFSKCPVVVGPSLVKIDYFIQVYSLTISSLTKVPHGFNSFTKNTLGNYKMLLSLFLDNKTATCLRPTLCLSLPITITVRRHIVLLFKFASNTHTHTFHISLLCNQNHLANCSHGLKLFHR